MTRTLKIAVNADQATCITESRLRCRFLYTSLTGQAECLLFHDQLQVTNGLSGRVVRCVECLEAEVES